jgi:hypothetical protein
MFAASNLERQVTYLLLVILGDSVQIGRVSLSVFVLSVVESLSVAHVNGVGRLAFTRNLLFHR